MDDGEKRADRGIVEMSSHTIEVAVKIAQKLINDVLFSNHIELDTTFRAIGNIASSSVQVLVEEGHLSTDDECQAIYDRILLPFKERFVDEVYELRYSDVEMTAEIKAELEDEVNYRDRQYMLRNP